MRFVKLAPALAHAAALADNKLGEVSTWDSDLLAEILKTGVVGLEDMQVAGFSDDELERLGKAPELPANDFSETSMTVTTKYECPKCGHKWRAKPAGKGVNAKPVKAA